MNGSGPSRVGSSGRAAFLTPVLVAAALAGNVAATGCAPEVRSESRPSESLVYVWSPSMPLSLEGIPEIREAADRIGVTLSLIPATAVIEGTSERPIETLRASLVEAGATVHYPSLAVFVNGDVQGNAIVGYKQADAYVELLRGRLRAVGMGDVAAPAPLGERATSPGPPDVEVLWTHTVEPPPGAFFRRVPGTTLITFDQRRTVHLRDLTSGEQFRGPGWIDFVPTPDGRLFVTPGEGNSGLEFYLVADVLERGADGTAEALEPLVRDRQMNDQYPSVGILREDADGGPTRYRILVSWFSGLAFRDYEVGWVEGRPPEVEALTDKLTACPGRELSIPILSKDGRELAARDEDTGTTKVFHLNDDASCTELLDLGRQTSKVGFSDDGTLIAYSSPEPSSGGSGTRSWTYVFDRRDMETLRVPHSESAGLVIPELVGADSLLIAVKESARSRTSEFRLLCCVR